MYPSTHLVTSLVLVIILYPLYGINSFCVLIGGVLIDVDHYFWYVYKRKDFNILNSYNYYIQKKHKENKHVCHVFHLAEFWILMLIASYFSELLLVVTLGMILHIGLDVYDMIKRNAYSDRVISVFQFGKVCW